jgi:hypothetical protein
LGSGTGSVHGRVSSERRTEIRERFDEALKRWKRYLDGHEWLMVPANRWDPDYDDRAATVEKRAAKFGLAADTLSESLRCDPVAMRELIHFCAEGKPPDDE